MAHHVIFDLDAVTATHVWDMRAISSVLPQLLRSTIESFFRQFPPKRR
jgi:hypothetical protein